LGEEQEDESRLAQAPGMNVFTAATILSKVTLGDFLEMTSEERQERFNGLVGAERVSTLNERIPQRAEYINQPSSDGPGNHLSH